ncbi:MAG: hypothetical protein H6736_07290 [Alphaproteobacteria bacterium]|nr:hypothetical protein [Alphaproteobacteria bacterium]
MHRRGWTPGDLPGLVLDLACAAGGSWWIYSVAAVYAGLSFDTYMAGLFGFVPAAVALLVWVAWTPEGVETPASPEASDLPLQPSAGLAAASAVVITAWWALDLPFALGGLFAAVTVGVALWNRPWTPAFGPTVADRRDAAGLAVAIGAFCMFVAWVHHPIWDDAYHVNAILSTLEHPDLPLLSFDGLHGDTSVPIQQLIHRPQTHEVAVATLARLTGIDGRTLYWLVLPQLFAALLVIASWRLAKAVDARSAWLAAPLVVFVLVCWGGDIRTYGAYAVLRLFEGKAFFYGALIPALVVAAGRFATAPSARTWALLLLTQCWCAMFSSSALVLAPIAAGLALLPFLARRTAPTLAAGLAASAPLVAVLLLMKLEVSGVGGLRSDGWVRSGEAVIGTTLRAPLAMALFAASPLAVVLRRTPSGWLPAYALASFLLVFNAFTPAVLSRVASLFSWRLYWCVPLPALLATVVAMLTLALWDRRKGGAAVLVAFCVAFWAAGPTSWTYSENTSFRFMAWRNDPDVEATAEAVVALTTPADLVLAPPRVAERIAMQTGRPRLMSIREQYLVNLARHWGDDETLRRMRLMMLVEGTLPRLKKFQRTDQSVYRMRGDGFPPDAEPWREKEKAFADLETSEIRVVVVRDNVKFQDRLEAMGFREAVSFPRYQVFVRDPQPTR